MKIQNLQYSSIKEKTSYNYPKWKKKSSYWHENNIAN
jgi:hypothetical protein